ncbi:aminoglycoside phosphotransferase family protein [Brackiella oedipodis]|uniref:aminoglycoside phosphotransferase family protein n=1 Tax=Brackiella oedipodis TaxID=124225 RepID=UPI000490651D|nr:phosphotransferase [Brackiella oedipodis]
MQTSLPQDSRVTALQQWLQPLQTKYDLHLNTLSTASADASFRRYFRLQAGNRSLIVMDAPAPQEDVATFVHIDHLLAASAVNVPQILEQDVDQGFLLLNDLGDMTYYARLQQAISHQELQKLYREAIDALVHMQQADASSLGHYDAERMRSELDLFETWYVQQHCQEQLSEAEQKSLYALYDQLVTEISQEATVFMHRDFHSPNLMIYEGPEGNNPAVIDFQDALQGPISYDIVSLIMDARTTWQEAQQLDWAIRYWQKAKQAGLPIPEDFAVFHAQYERMSLQRNLRILGVFARLAIRDHKPHYLAHMPRVQKYVRQVIQRYQRYAPLLKIFNRLENVQTTSGYTF